MATNAGGLQRDEQRSTHAALLHRLVAAGGGSTTSELHLLYDAVAPMVYRGTTSTPDKRRRRRDVLAALVDEGCVEYHDTPRGRVWVPVAMPEGVSVRHTATEARAAQEGHDA